MHWLPVTFRINYKVALFVFKIVNNMAPSYICDLVETRTESHELRSSSPAIRLVVRKARLPTYGNRAFSFYAPRIWNKLPWELRQMTNCERFKKALKTHYFKIAFS